MRLGAVLRAIEPHPFRNVGLKLLSLGLAVLLWAAVTGEERVPQVNPNAPVELVNLPEHLAVAAPYPDAVEVRLRGPARLLRDLSPWQVGPRIDMSEAHAGENIILLSPDDIPVPFGVDVERITPNEIRVVLEERVEAPVPVTAVVEGDPAPGYEVVAKRVEPAEVLVSGPRSRVGRIGHVRTETVDIAGLQETLAQRVAVRSGDPFIQIRAGRTVLLTIEIQEAAITRQYGDVAIEVVNSPYRTAVNPDRIGVVVSAPPSVLEGIGPDSLRAVIDAAGLEPRREDYLIEPRIVFEPEELGQRVEVLALTPQRRVNVHIFPARVSG